MLSSLRWSAWGPEYSALAGAIISFAAMVTLLAHFDGRDVFTWQGVTLNAIVSILSVATKAAIAYVLAECMAQWKWILFAREERPLIDFDRIDSATRGPLGSLRIIFRTHGALPVQFGAILTLLAVGLDPLAQQLIQLEQTVLFTHSGSNYFDGSLPALISRATYYAMGSTMVNERSSNNSTRSSYEVKADTPLSMQGAVLNGLSKAPWEAEQEALVQCPTSNCTFGQFNTVGICHRCSDVSSNLRRVEDFGEVFLSIPETGYGGTGVPSTAFVLPNGHFIANIDGCPPYNGVFPDCHIDTMLWSMSIIYPDVEALNKSGSFTPGEGSFNSEKGLAFWPDIAMEATECSLYYCVKQINSEVRGNQLKENITQAPGFRRDPESWQRLQEKEPENALPQNETGTLEFNRLWSVVTYSDLIIESPDKTQERYRVAEDSVKSLSAHFQQLFRGSWDNSTELREKLDAKLGTGAVGFNGASFGPFGTLHGGMKAQPPALDGLWTWSRNNISSIFSSLATSMTNEMRRNFDPQTQKQTGQDTDRFRDGTLSYWGSVGSSSTLYRIEWPWIALHGGLLLAAIFFLALTLGNTIGKGDIPLWKSSSLAAIRHGRDVGGLLSQTSTIGDMEATARKMRVKMRRDNIDEAKPWLDSSVESTPREP
ncbi:hypothetical protein CkaCkLH20_00642 [Colletotrichum karsti]|uniref:Uncharacterized protein n=1 Tax=Colletotrichum karsti TaxID=1095194 RepID=A0A9P6II57_9PEZI|nr:uncharacterized protein CkaCkLH20_00642 [Colletotrichum karsti]KAF9881496.1 hypothetical protein CkaCkLH20_00642 [Colletotrichum karsti]